jgi:hypothetical protein
MPPARRRPQDSKIQAAVLGLSSAHSVAEDLEKRVLSRVGRRRLLVTFPAPPPDAVRPGQAALGSSHASLWRWPATGLSRLGGSPGRLPIMHWGLGQFEAASQVLAPRAPRTKPGWACMHASGSRVVRFLVLAKADRRACAPRSPRSWAGAWAAARRPRAWSRAARRVLTWTRRVTWTRRWRQPWGPAAARRVTRTRTPACSTTCWRCTPAKRSWQRRPRPARAAAAAAARAGRRARARPGRGRMRRARRRRRSGTMRRCGRCCETPA